MNYRNLVNVHPSCYPQCTMNIRVSFPHLLDFHRFQSSYSSISPKGIKFSTNVVIDHGGRFDLEKLKSMMFLVFVCQVLLLEMLLLEKCLMLEWLVQYRLVKHNRIFSSEMNRIG